MNKKLFISGYIDKISKRFSLSEDLAFEIFVNAVFLTNFHESKAAFSVFNSL